MATTRLSTKGQIVLPKVVRDAHNWRSGTELDVIAHPEGVLLRARRPTKQYTLDDLYGCLRYDGPAVSVEDMSRAVDEMFKREWK